MKILLNGRLQKVRWGAVAGTSFIELFYLTAGIVAAYIILNAVAGATNDAVGLFDNWWQTLLFVLDVVVALLFVCSVVMFVLKRVNKPEAMPSAQGGESK